MGKEEKYVVCLQAKEREWLQATVREGAWPLRC